MVAVGFPVSNYTAVSSASGVATNDPVLALSERVLAHATNQKAKVGALFALLKKVPHELRDQIYAEVLKQPEGVLITTARFIPRPKPALLSVCRQFRYEATPIYYAANTFHAIISEDETSKAPFVWLASLTPDERTAIKTLLIEFRLSEPVIARLEGIVENFQAAATRAISMPGMHLNVLVAIRRMVDFCKEPWGLARVRELADDMRRAKNEMGFDLTKLKFEAGAVGGRFHLMNSMWKDFLEACREAAVEGREVEIK